MPESAVRDAALPESVVAQHCVLVLPSTGEFDSRTYRIASTLVRRGHRVTVMARAESGLPAEEIHPEGYRIVRVPVSAVAGLPWPIRPVAVRFWRTRGRSGSVAPETAAPGRRPSTADGAEEGTARPRGAGLTARIASGLGAIVRLAALGLTVRAQRIATERRAPRADLVHSMAYMGIPVGLALGRRDRAPVIYDARDIYADAANLARLPGPARRFFAWIERRWAQQATRVITVNDAYADVMTERFGTTRPLVVMNCSYLRRPPTDRPRSFHERLGLPPATRVVLYQGGFTRDRGIEQLIATIPDLPSDAVVVLLGYGGLRQWLERQAVEPGNAGRLFVLPAVAPTELLDWVSAADVVAMLIQPTTLNHRLTTPNKLFEAMAVGVPVVASDLPGMAEIVRATGCGVVCDPTDPGKIAGAINGILGATVAERDAYRDRALAAVRDTYNWEHQVAELLAEYGRLTGRPW